MLSISPLLNNSSVKNILYANNFSTVIKDKYKVKFYFLLLETSHVAASILTMAVHCRMSFHVSECLSNLIAS